MSRVVEMVRTGRLARWLAPLLMSTLLAACATTERYERSLNALVGLREAELVQQLGRPNRTYESGGFRYLVYTTSDTATVAGMANGYQTTGVGVHERRVSVGGSPDLAIEAACTTTFELDQGKVVAWAHKGNYCKSGQ